MSDVPVYRRGEIAKLARPVVTKLRPGETAVIPIPLDSFVQRQWSHRVNSVCHKVFGVGNYQITRLAHPPRLVIKHKERCV